MAVLQRKRSQGRSGHIINQFIISPFLASPGSLINYEIQAKLNRFSIVYYSWLFCLYQFKALVKRR